MSWIILEGVDKTGKSTICETYRKKGYEVIHLKAPDKKYTHPGYAGPAYCDELLDLVIKYDGKDVIWDRSWYSEFIWPTVYGRDPQLTEEDLDIFQEYENKNDTQRMMTIDPDEKAHWQRCVDYNEPLKPSQFKIANALHQRLAHKYNFIPVQLKDFMDVSENKEQSGNIDVEIHESQTEQERSDQLIDKCVTTQDSSQIQKTTKTTTQEKKLARAVAYDQILKKKILTKKDPLFQEIEVEIKEFLSNKLKSIFNEQPSNDLNNEEIQVLKTFVQRLKQKQQ